MNVERVLASRLIFSIISYLLVYLRINNRLSKREALSVFGCISRLPLLSVTLHLFLSISFFLTFHSRGSQQLTPPHLETPFNVNREVTVD